MKRNAIVRIVLFSIAILLLLSVLAAGILARIYSIDFGSHHESHTVDHLPVTSDEFTSRGAVKAEGVTQIEIDWIAGSVSICPVDNTDQITLSETGNDNEKYSMIYRLDGDTLKIQYCNDSIKFPSFGISANITKDLVINVPAGWGCDSLEIDTASALVNIYDMIIDEFDFDGASGICNITGCHMDKIDLDTASGDINFEGTLNTLDCDAASANCRIYVTNVPNSIDIDTASGNLELMLPEDCGFTCAMETLSGNFHSEFETSSNNGVHIYGDGNCRINVDAMSGDVNICKNTNHHNGHHAQ